MLYNTFPVLIKINETKLTPFLSYEAYFNIEHLHFHTRSTGKQF